MSIFKFKENFRQIHAKESKRKNENSESTFEIGEKKKAKIVAGKEPGNTTLLNLIIFLDNIM